jgi:dephospho-CoA kinase
MTKFKEPKMSYMDKHLNNIYSRLQNLEQRSSGIYKVLEEIIGKELLRGQALHKVLMDKAVFTDAELKTALEKLVAEAKADMVKMKEVAEAEKAKAVELLVPEGFKPTPTSEASHIEPKADEVK